MVGRGRAQQVGLSPDGWLGVFFDFEWRVGQYQAASCRRNTVALVAGLTILGLGKA